MLRPLLLFLYALQLLRMKSSRCSIKQYCWIAGSSCGVSGSLGQDLTPRLLSTVWGQSTPPPSLLELRGEDIHSLSASLHLTTLQARRSGQNSRSKYSSLTTAGLSSKALANFSKARILCQIHKQVIYKIPDQVPKLSVKDKQKTDEIFSPKSAVSVRREVLPTGILTTSLPGTGYFTFGAYQFEIDTLAASIVVTAVSGISHEKLLNKHSRRASTQICAEICRTIAGNSSAGTQNASTSSFPGKHNSEKNVIGLRSSGQPSHPTMHSTVWGVPEVEEPQLQSLFFRAAQCPEKVCASSQWLRRTLAASSRHLLPLATRSERVPACSHPCASSQQLPMGRRRQPLPGHDFHSVPASPYKARKPGADRGRASVWQCSGYTFKA
ncbi:hypothetical protein Anapl_08347 [Anas platyrhynchos]|uniref:Uncharacterized protein n=1 Tax=Anas platyrhynchos TaxID=8839 RepID=R0M739_ANAPL|nr:hypothetical protein Anapl_08347 [Anas platyrhynchos]